MQNGRKTVSSRRGHVGDSLRKCQKSYRRPDIYKRSLAGTGRSGFLYNYLRRSSSRRVPIERNKWRNMKKILFGRNLIELCMCWSENNRREKVGEEPSTFSLSPVTEGRVMLVTFRGSVVWCLFVFCFALL